MPAAVFGMRGTGSWSANERPGTWRETMLWLYPNGALTLTAISSMLRSEGTDDPTFNWWTKSMPVQGGAATGVYTDTALAVAYVSGATIGTQIFVKTSAEVASEFRPGHTAMLRKIDDIKRDTRGKVLQVVINGAASYLALRMIENDDAAASFATADFIKIIGNINPEGATMPTPVGYVPTPHSNVTQIWRTPLSITRTARKGKLRGGRDGYVELKREALEVHGMEIEKSLIWGQRYEGIGDNNQPERATQGIVEFIRTNAPENVVAYHLDPAYAGKTWVLGGEDWMDAKLEQLYRSSTNGEKLVIAGSGVMLALRRLARASGQVTVTSTQLSYGLKVQQWETAYGTMYLKTHPLFSHDVATRNDALIIEPSSLRVRPLDDTFFVSDPQDHRNRNHSKDATEEEFITELGLEMHNPYNMGYFSGFGKNNVMV